MTVPVSLTQRRILLFWLPLAATWLMMSIEGPFLAAVIARLSQPKYNLAAYGVAFSFAMLMESPVIMIMTASTALVKDRDSLRTLGGFTLRLNADSWAWATPSPRSPTAPACFSFPGPQP